MLKFAFTMKFWLSLRNPSLNMLSLYSPSAIVKLVWPLLSVFFTWLSNVASASGIIVLSSSLKVMVMLKNRLTVTEVETDLFHLPSLTFNTTIYVPLAGYWYDADAAVL